MTDFILGTSTEIIPVIWEMNFEPLNTVSLAHYWVRNWPGRGGILARSRNVEYFLKEVFDSHYQKL
jgi:hypothetical protein